MTAHYNSNELCRLRYVTSCASEGRAFAILLTRERYLYWFVDDVLRQVIHVPDFPLGKLMWGVVDISGNCYGIRAEIQTGKLVCLQLRRQSQIDCLYGIN